MTGNVTPPGVTRTSADIAAFEQEAIPHLHALHRTALRLTRSEAAAEDLVQDTLERAFKNFHRYERGTNMRAWLFKILNFAAISNFRRASSGPQQASLEGMEEFSLYHETRAAGIAPADVEDRVLDRIGEETIRDAIDQLPEQYRIVVLLCDVEGFAYREIAEILEIPQGTVMSRLFRARTQLQKLLWEFASTAGYVSAARFDELRKRG